MATIFKRCTTFYLTLVSEVLGSCGLAETACISDVFLVLLAKATFRFLWMTSVSGVPTFCPGLDPPPGVSNSPSASLKMNNVFTIILSIRNTKKKQMNQVC